MNSPYLSQYGHKSLLIWDHNEIFHITKKLHMQHAWKIGIQINNTVYTSKEKNYQFPLKKKPSATKHSPP